MLRVIKLDKNSNILSKGRIYTKEKDGKVCS